MVKQIDKNEARLRRHRRVRNKISGTAARPRLDVFRSAKHIYAQIIDDEQGVTLVPVATHLHKQPSGKWSSSERCTGTVRTLRCQYHNECLRPFHKKSQAGIRKVT